MSRRPGLIPLANPLEDQCQVLAARAPKARTRRCRVEIDIGIVLRALLIVLRALLKEAHGAAAGGTSEPHAVVWRCHTGYTNRDHGAAVVTSRQVPIVVLV